MRVAVFFTPPAGHPLVNAAASWLGRDAFSGESPDRGPVVGFEQSELDALTADARRYGFHATLKPPFRIADGHDLARVRAAAAAFGQDHAPAAIASVSLARIGPFFALTADGCSAAVDGLASEVVRRFEPFRAPLTEAETARRGPERLTLPQRANLEAWGYPYVFDEFRFHMTLTGPVPEASRPAVESVLRDRFARFIGEPLMVDGIALFVESSPPGDFVVDTRINLEAVAQTAVGT